MSEYLLTEINLWGNNIRDEGERQSERLKVNTSLTEISLYGNNIGAEGERQSERH